MDTNAVSDIPQGFKVESQSDIPQGFQIESHPFVGGLVGQGLDLAFNKAPAAIREGIRSVGSGHTLDEAGQSANKAYANPNSSESFQHQLIRNTNEALPSNTNELMRNVAGVVPSAVGLAADTITNPGQLLTMLGTEGLAKKISPIEYKGISLGKRATQVPIQNLLDSVEGQSSKALNLSSKAADTTAKLFPNHPGTLDEVRNMSQSVAPYISKANSYPEVASQMELAKGFPMEERQGVYDTNSTVADRSHLNKINDLISSESNPETNSQAGSNASNTRLRQYKDIQTAETNSLNKIPNDKLNDPKFWQDKKAEYQQLAKDSGAYGASEKMSARATAYKALAQGAQDKTYALSKNVLPLNLEHANLSQAQGLAEDLAKAELLGKEPSLGKEAVQAISPGDKIAVARFARKSLGDRLFGSPAKGLTGKISSLTNKSENAQSVADLLESIKNIKQNTPPTSKSLIPALQISMKDLAKKRR